MSASFAGDGVMVYFGYPTAHGNDAERALRAALEMIARLDSLEITPLAEGPLRLSARIGVHTGLVVVGPERMSSGPNLHGVVGEAANVAARLQNEAPAHGIVVSRDTQSLVEHLFDFLPLGPLTLKGLSRTVAAFQLIRAKPVAGERFHTTGQERPNDRARGGLIAPDRMLGDGPKKSSPQVVVVGGEAGVGKTRLINEFFSHPSLGTVTVAQTQCHEIFSNTALSPVSGYFWKRAGLTLDDDQNGRRQKLRRFLEQLGLGNEDNNLLIERIPGLGSSLSAPPVENANLFKLRQFQLIKDTLLKGIKSGPLILSVEDAHWLDPSSAELLRDIPAALERKLFLLLITTRSYPRGPRLPSPNETIRLEQLALADSLELARSVPGAQDLPEDLVSRAVRAADGVPLFVEQLILSLVEQGGKYTHRGRRSTNLPLVLAEMLSERLDRRQGARRIVQAAACLGRSFSPQSLAAILDEDVTKLREQLNLLVDAEILQPTRYGVELRYEFRHALLQLTARDSMVERERRGMHARIAEFLETAINSHAPPEELAYHLTEAGDFLRAIRRWLEAGLNAARQSTHLEAIDHLRKGLNLLDNVPDPGFRRNLEIGLQVALMSSLAVTQFATSLELSACCERGIQLCREQSENEMVFPFIFGQFTFANCRGRVGEARTLADLFISLAEVNQYDSGLVIGHRLRGMCLLGQGEVREAKTELKLSLALYSEQRDAGSVERFGQNPRVHTQSLLALAMFCLGEVKQALLLGRDTLFAADALREPHSTAIALSYIGGLIFGYCGASKHLAEHARRLNAICDEHKLSGYRPHAMAFLGWAQCQDGDLESGAAKIEAAIKAFDSAEYKLGVSAHLCNLADALRRLRTPP